MNQFTIRDIENLCNIKAHTLRIWEQRYKLFIAQRKESRHRTYSNEDLKELLRISFLYHNGYKISRIAELSTEEIRAAVETTLVKDDNYEIFVHQLIEASVDFDKEKFDKIINSLVLCTGFEKCIISVFYPFLQRIGLLWMTNNVIPAQEHFSSHIIRKKIICAIDRLEPVCRNGKSILVFAPEGEYHEIPLLAVNYFFRKNNNNTVYFGVNVSLNTLKYFIAHHHSCSYLYAHIITRLHQGTLTDFINGLCNSFPDKKVILSGPGCMCIDKKPPNLEIFSSMQEMMNFAKTTGQTA
jgi:DNA-binding transcriptional MerR regulator